MTFHLPGNDSLVTVSNALSPFSERALAVLLVPHEAGLHADDPEFRKLLTNAEHGGCLLE